jgi:PAS domain S-box-containing protein
MDSTPQSAKENLRVSSDLLSLGNQAYLADLVPMAAYAVRAPDGVIVWFNKRATDLWGRVPNIGDTEERFCGSHKLYRTDGSFLAHCDTPVAQALFSGESTHEAEVVVERTDGTRISVCVFIDPVRDKTGRVIGAINFFHDISERKHKDAERERLFEELKSYSAKLGDSHGRLEQRTVDLQIANVKLTKIDEARQRSQEQVERLSQQLLGAQEDERRSVAKEVHEGVGQYLGGLSLSLVKLRNRVQGDAECIRILDDCSALIHDAGREIRTISYLLRPPMIDEMGIKPALNWLVRGFKERSGIRVSLEMSPEIGRLNPEVELTVFRIVQEGLTNIHRHSQSETASIKLMRRSGNVVLEISDTGKGMSETRFDPNKRSGVGIASMKERAKKLNGSFEIQSHPNRGVTIRLSFPVV